MEKIARRDDSELAGLDECVVALFELGDVVGAALGSAVCALHDGDECLDEEAAGGGVLEVGVRAEVALERGVPGDGLGGAALVLLGGVVGLGDVEAGGLDGGEQLGGGLEGRGEAEALDLRAELGVLGVVGVELLGEDPLVADEGRAGLEGAEDLGVVVDGRGEGGAGGGLDGESAIEGVVADALVRVEVGCLAGELGPAVVAAAAGEGVGVRVDADDLGALEEAGDGAAGAAVEAGGIEEGAGLVEAGGVGEGLLVLGERGVDGLVLVAGREVRRGGLAHAVHDGVDEGDDVLGDGDFFLGGDVFLAFDFFLEGGEVLVQDGGIAGLLGVLLFLGGGVPIADFGGAPGAGAFVVVEATHAVVAEAAEEELLLLFVVELAVEVDEVLGEGVPLGGEDPVDEKAFLAVAEDGGGALAVLLFGFLVELVGLGPVDEGGVVVDDVVVFVPDVVLAVEDGDGVDVLVGGVLGLDEGVPEVAHGAEEGDGLAHGVDEVGEDEEQAGVAGDDAHAEEPPGLAEEDLGGEAVFCALEEEGEARDAGPVEEEAGEPEDVVGEDGAVQVDVGVDVIGVVVPAMVDLVVAGGVGAGHGAVEEADPHGVDAVEGGEGTLEEALVGVALLVDEDLVVGEEAVAGAEAEKVVDDHGRELEAVGHVALVGDVGEDGEDEGLEDGPGEEGVVAGIDHDDLGEGMRGAVDTVAGLRVELGADGRAHEVADHLAGDGGEEDERDAGHGDEEERDAAHGEPGGVGEEAPGERALVVALHAAEDLGEEAFGGLLVTLAFLFQTGDVGLSSCRRRHFVLFFFFNCVFFLKDNIYIMKFIFSCKKKKNRSQKYVYIIVGCVSFFSFI